MQSPKRQLAVQIYPKINSSRVQSRCPSFIENLSSRGDGSAADESKVGLLNDFRVQLGFGDSSSNP
jgi:hypothetical protein